jgi:hypothetical protein
MVDVLPAACSATSGAIQRVLHPMHRSRLRSGPDTSTWYLNQQAGLDYNFEVWTMYIWPRVWGHLHDAWISSEVTTPACYQITQALSLLIDIEVEEKEVAMAVSISSARRCRDCSPSQAPFEFVAGYSYSHEGSKDSQILQFICLFSIHWLWVFHRNHKISGWSRIFY